MAAFSFTLFATLVAYSTLVTATEIDQEVQSFTGIYEPSGLSYLGESEFILVEDEPQHPFHLLQLNSEGKLIEVGEIKRKGRQIRLNDLEGVTFDGQFVYAITSHSLTRKGKQGKGRSILARYRYQDGELVPAGMILDLKHAIITQLNLRYPRWDSEMLKQQLNIESLVWSSATQSLYIGLRAPVIDGASLIMRIDGGLSALFDQESAVGLEAQIIALDLGGVGIRAMAFDDQKNQFLIVAGDKKKNDGQFFVWSWRDQADAEPQKYREIKEGSEGLTGFETEALAGWVLLQDDGKRNKGKPAHYQILFKR